MLRTSLYAVLTRLQIVLRVLISVGGCVFCQVTVALDFASTEVSVCPTTRICAAVRTVFKVLAASTVRITRRLLSQTVKHVILTRRAARSKLFAETLTASASCIRLN